MTNQYIFTETFPETAAAGIPSSRIAFAFLLRSTVFAILFFALLPLSLDVGTFRFYTLDAALFLLIPLFLIAYVNRGIRTNITWHGAEKVLFVFTAVMFLSSVFSDYPANTIFLFATWIRVVVFYVLLRHLLAWDVVGARHIRPWWTFFLCFLLLTGLIEIAYDPTVCIVSRYFGVFHEEETTFLDTIRISGTARDANLFGDWLVVFCLGCTAGLADYGRKRGSAVLFVLFLNALALFVIITTLSRGAIVFYAIANSSLLFFTLFKKKKSLLITILISSFIAAILIIFSFFLAEAFSSQISNWKVYERFMHIEDSRRSMLVSLGFRLLGHAKVFFLGTGLGAFFPSLVEHGYSYKCLGLYRDLSTVGWGIHNFFIKILVEGGVFSLLLFLLACALFLKDSFLAVFRLDPHRSGHGYTFVLYAAALFLAFLAVPMQIHTCPTTLEFMVFLSFITAIFYDMKQKGLGAPTPPPVPAGDKNFPSNHAPKP